MDISREDIEGAVSSLITGLLEAPDELSRKMLERELESLLADFSLDPLSGQFLSSYRRVGRDLHVLKRPYLEQLHLAASQLSEECLAGNGESTDDMFTAGERKRVLVVDDDPDFLQLLPMQLQGMGHQCDVSDSADGALLFLGNQPVDVLIVDILMPGVSGPELVRRGQEAGILPPKTMFMSALPYQRIKSLAEEFGIEFLQKPCTNDELGQLVG